MDAANTNEEIDGISETDLQKIFKQTGNLNIVNEIATLAKTDMKAAKARMEYYKKKRITKEMKWLLTVMMKAPEKTFSIIRPVLVEVHKKLEEESTLYKTIANPIFDFIEGIGNVTLRGLGFTIQTVADVVQIINGIVYEGAVANNSETPHADKFAKVNSAMGKVKEFGEMLNTDGKARLDNISLRRAYKMQKKPAVNTATS